ncbi:Zinc finger C3HC4 type (RING finger) family protein [Babesia bovis T2Bo]|uniref:E3 ubiquitin protein ligase n=1 Tax=Babesia bovis TaxID=5865 RepID=A7APS2_BABBO|nr:Zinc finger C3HC4 type (RING finger) family protein [Babesia bovis T2Bo]EDO08556.1 Zinc finger C3HC4 type (RING finger) family protein [Babesia bovis T2Bo]|eukprot:XP_001612124.1 hypothetical protein [Babesia bovis T2Bo]
MTKKRAHDVLAEVFVDLPCQDDSRASESFVKLRDCLVGYRSEVERLESRNAYLVRENECLRDLCSSIGTLWDVLNDEFGRLVDGTKVASDRSVVTEDTFLDSLHRNRLPFSVIRSKQSAKTLPFDIASSVSDTSSEGNTIPGDVELESSLSTHLEAFNRRKDELVKRVQQCCLLGSHTTNGSSDEQLSIERGYRRILELAVGRLYDLLDQSRAELSIQRMENGKLEVEISRLTKVNSTLRHSLDEAKSEITQLTRASTKEVTSPTTAAASSSASMEVRPPQADKIRSVDDITEAMIVGSTLYSRLYHVCVAQDGEINRLEKENCKLRSTYQRMSLDKDQRLFEYIQRYESTHNSLIEHVSTVDRRLDEYKGELQYQRELQRRLEAQVSSLQSERDALMSKIESKDRLYSDHLNRMSKIIGTSNSDSGVADYQEQLQNLSVELEEISLAYEEKVTENERLQRQLKELNMYRDKCANTDFEIRAMEEKLSRARSFCDRRIEGAYDFHKALTNRLTAYRNTWLSSYRRSLLFEKKRDIASSALCESQARLRRCQRDLKECQSRLSYLLPSGGDNNTNQLPEGLDVKGDICSVIRENEVLRRRMICTLCSEHFRDRCLTQCGHVFCEACINSSIKSRNRKCPACKVVFDRNDVKRLYFD